VRAGRPGNDDAAHLRFETKLWQTADALRNNMDAAEYKHVVLGLIFLKYISDAFEAKLAKIAGTYHAWRGDPDAGDYADVPGFSRAAKLHDIRKHGHVLTPGRYVGAAAVEEDDEPFDEKCRTVHFGPGLLRAA
jgi:type I restriction-modification system DNA methylase subunit